MTQDEIIRMAWKTGLVIDGNFSGNDALFAFANLVAAAEREACAKVCDEINTDYDGEEVSASWIATAIRARGNT